MPAMAVSLSKLQNNVCATLERSGVKKKKKTNALFNVYLIYWETDFSYCSKLPEVLGFHVSTFCKNIGLDL